jgi:hypothetical protein
MVAPEISPHHRHRRGVGGTISCGTDGTAHDKEHPMPGRPTDAERDRANALHLLTYAKGRVDVAYRQMFVAMRFAREQGASDRDIAEATDLPLAKVRQLLDRSA